MQLFCVFFHFFFLKIASLSCPFSLPHSGFGAEREQLDEGAEEGVQPALVGHALLNHFLLTWVLSRLLNGVGLEKRIISVSKENRNEKINKNKVKCSDSNQVVRSKCHITTINLCKKKQCVEKGCKKMQRVKRQCRTLR